jgi:hypothetical protein
MKTWKHRERYDKIVFLTVERGKNPGLQLKVSPLALEKGM